jgi:hypothetical protein
MQVLSRALVVVLCASFPASAEAAVRVKINGVLQTTNYGSNDPIPIAVDSSTTLINVYAESPATTDIGVITLSGEPSQEVGIVIGTIGQFPGSAISTLDNAARNLGGVQVAAGSDLLLQTVRLAGAVSGSLTGDINVGQVFRLQVDGDTQGAITANGTSPSVGEVMDHLVIGGTTHGAITVSGGPNHNQTANLASLIAGGVQAPVNVTYGGITELRSFGPISVLSTGTISAQRGIVSLIAKSATNVPQNINAAIIANDGLYSTGVLHYLYANTVSGSVSTYNMADFTPTAGDGFYAQGDLDAPITIAQDSYAPIDVRGGFTSNAYVSIGQDLRNDIVAHGSITYIHVGGQVTASPTQHLTIKSETGDIGDITVIGPVTCCNDGCTPGVDVRIYAAGTVNSINCGGASQLSGFSLRNSVDPSSGWVAVGKLIAEGTLALDMRCSTFDIIELYRGTGTTGDGSPEDPFEEMHFLSIPAGKALLIGEFLAEEVFVDGIQTFDGQIITNASCNDPGGWGDNFNVYWHNDDNQYYSLVPHPFYTQTSGPMGGGAVANVTDLDNSGTSTGFRAIGLHQLDCDPPAGSVLCQTPMTTRVWPSETSDVETVVFRHYGPVFNSVTTNPYHIYRAPFDIVCNPTCTLTWTDVTSLFRFVVTPFGHEREVWISPTSGQFDRKYNYKVELVTFDDSGTTRTRLRADHTFKKHEFDAPSVVNYPYFLFFPVCMDLNMNGTIDSADLMAWMDNRADLNVDFSADEQDLIMMLDSLTGSVPP